jgi:polar amino acid transport system substrate-binding protein
VLRWGGDASGGAPYIIDRGPDQQPEGFEAELADYLAGKLGLRPEFVRKQWDSLPQDLRRGDVDVILNGYEWFPERERVMASTVPYYAYRLRLVARRDGAVRGWDDLRRGPRKKVGVLKDSAAHRYVEGQYGKDVEIVALGDDGTTGVMSKVVGRDFDATVQDAPVIAWYLKRKNEFPELQAVGEAVRPFPNSYYVLFVRQGDDALRAKLNAALTEALRDGTLQKIYERYGLWDPDQEHLLEAARSWPPPGTGPDPTSLGFFSTLARAALVTVELACLAMPLATLAGLLVAVGRLYGPGWLAAPLALYVEVVRGTPLLLQLSVIYYFLPEVGVRLHPFWAGVLGLAFNYAAYEAENYRAGLLAVPRGQLEAALALGMSPWTALRRVIIPQAVRIVVPPVTNDFISLFKDTSICSVIAVVELTGQYRTLMVTNPHRLAELGAMTALLYLLMSYPLSLVARRLERRFHKV